ncbi:MAG: YfiR family protein [Desulfococcaceae bacterium]
MIVQSPFRHLRPPALALILFMAATFSPLFPEAAAQETDALEGAEYRVKAAFVYHFARFTHWPDGAFERPESPLILCVAGEPPGIEALFSLRDKLVRGRPILVRRFAPDEAAACHVLFVGMASPERVARAMGAVRRKGVLTIGESDAFVQQCGIIHFFLEGDHLRFGVNLSAAGRAEIRFSSQLLMSAEILQDPEACPRSPSRTRPEEE